YLCRRTPLLRGQPAPRDGARSGDGHRRLARGSTRTTRARDAGPGAWPSSASHGLCHAPGTDCTLACYAERSGACRTSCTARQPVARRRARPWPWSSALPHGLHTSGRVEHHDAVVARGVVRRLVLVLSTVVARRDQRLTHHPMLLDELVG